MRKINRYRTMMTSSNGNISALVALCAGNSPVTGELPSQRPVTQGFDVFFDVCLNIRLSKQSWGWWFETPSPSLWSHCNTTTNSCLYFMGCTALWQGSRMDELFTRQWETTSFLSKCSYWTCIFIMNIVNSRNSTHTPNAGKLHGTLLILKSGMLIEVEQWAYLAPKHVKPLWWKMLVDATTSPSEILIRLFFGIKFYPDWRHQAITWTNVDRP